MKKVVPWHNRFRRTLSVICAAIVLCFTAADRSEQTTASIPGKVSRYAQRLMQKYDADRDGQLQAEEWSRMRGNPARIDADRNGAISQDELAGHVAAFGRAHRIRPKRRPPPAVDLALLLAETIEIKSPDASDEDMPNGEEGATADRELTDQDRRELKYFRSVDRLPPGLPDWFIRRDADGDGQLTLAEFAPKAAKTQLDQFARHDLNRDGIITAKEYLRGTARGKKAAE